MASKPSILKITPFDVANGTEIKFLYVGNQPYKNKLIIRRSSDLEIVYENTVESFQTKNTIPPNTEGLQNGKQYTAEIIAYDQNDVPSPVSNKMFFWCLTTPVYGFLGINDGDVFETSSIVAEIEYEQEQWDDLAQYQFSIYDSTETLLFETPVLYDMNNISYNYKGLENLNSYYIRFTGVSQKGVYVDTGLVNIFIKYEQPTSYARIYAEEKTNNGVVDYRTNIKIIEATRDDYEYENGFIKLEDDELIYDSQFIVPGNFTMAVRHMFTLGTIMRCSNERDSFSLTIVDCTEGLYRYKLVVPNDICNYVIYSDPISCDGDSIMTCWIRRIDNVYQLYVYEEMESIQDYNLYIGETRPTTGTTNYDVWIDLDGSTVRIEKDDVVTWYQTEEPLDADSNNIWIGGDIE